MNKTEMYKEVATKLGTTQKAVKETMEAVQAVAFETLKAGEEIKLMDSVTLATKHVDACERRNPATGETFMAAPKEKVVCKLGKAIKDYVNA